MARKNAWSDHEIKLLGTMTDKRVAEAIGKKTNAVAQMRHRLKIAPFDEKRSSFQSLANFCIEQWTELSTLPQTEFYRALKNMSPDMTYKSLAEMCFVSHSRVQKWFAPGHGQEKLSLQMRHHMLLSVFINQK
jgi:hypothetical protein